MKKGDKVVISANNPMDRVALNVITSDLGSNEHDVGIITKVSPGRTGPKYQITFPDGRHLVKGNSYVFLFDDNLKQHLNITSKRYDKFLTAKYVSGFHLRLPTKVRRAVKPESGYGVILFTTECEWGINICNEDYKIKKVC